MIKQNLVVLILFILITSIFWIDHVVRFPGQQNQTHGLLVFPLSIEKHVDAVRLFSLSFENWVEQNGGNEHLNAQLTVIIQNVIREFCFLNTSVANMEVRSQCCQPDLRLSSKETMLHCLRTVGFIGKIPTVRTTDTRSRELPDRPPTFVHQKIYMNYYRGPNDKINCRVEHGRRERMYHLLRHWIDLAEQHGIVWWLAYGSLLGAVRDKDFIPYDHDVDIFVLGPQVDFIRSLSVEWRELNGSQIQLIKRSGSYCVNDHAIRPNCDGIPVHVQRDSCAFCTPLARLISDRSTYLDLFVVHAHVVVYPGEPSVTHLGLLVELADTDRELVQSYPMQSVFPLTTCNFMGLRVPCPRNASSVLTHIYGKNFIQPSKMCQQTFMFWYGT
ncbi:hypothetical protein EG68_00005 [Paragonimus skrjabini miyazakii]|uniref:LicD/FKTN/FKRP nucleotidyltransferase domain-containing protein n=1 Tax=Paragonimus skrjabini miyazakii TaxID=59628 RepID=A0A8S9Z737_9TREM|nr:hypothetical protein EG68_00005 [Paragonimus skrjabini miyazakii]